MYTAGKLVEETVEELIRRGDYTKALELQSGWAKHQAQVQVVPSPQVATSPQDVTSPLPPWAFTPDSRTLGNKLSLAGLLWVRCQRIIPYTSEGSFHSGLFDIGKLAVLNAVDAVQDGQQSVALFVLVDKEAMILHDDPKLFPSDSLLTKLIMLSETTQG